MTSLSLLEVPGIFNFNTLRVTRSASQKLFAWGVASATHTLYQGAMMLVVMLKPLVSSSIAILFGCSEGKLDGHDGWVSIQ